MIKEFNILIGSKIRLLRKKHKEITYADFAKIIDISVMQLSKYETGHNTISLEKLLKLRDYFKLPNTYFAGKENGRVDSIINDLSKLKYGDLELVESIVNFIKNKDSRNAHKQ